MSFSKFWITFHHQDVEYDRWALSLEAEREADCDFWQASGQTFEYARDHVSGARPENMPGFKDKLLLRDGLTQPEVNVLRKVAGNQPIDNDAEFWDCRIFCFEVLAELEKQYILATDDESYQKTRSQLHEKWANERITPKCDPENLDLGSQETAVLSAPVKTPHLNQKNESDGSHDDRVTR